MLLNIDLKQLIFNYLPLSLATTVSKKLNIKCWHHRYQSRYDVDLNSYKILTRLAPIFSYHIAAAYDQDEISDQSLPFLSVKRAAYIAAKTKNWELFTKICKVGSSLDWNIIPFMINDDKVELIKRYKILNLDILNQPLQFKSVEMAKIFSSIKYGIVNYYLNEYHDHPGLICNNYGLLAKAKRYLAGENIEFSNFYCSLAKNINNIDIDLIQDNAIDVVYFLADNIISNNNVISFSDLSTVSIIESYQMFKLAIDIFGQDRARRTLAIISGIVSIDITIALNLALDNYDINQINQISYYGLTLVQISILANRVDLLSQLVPPQHLFYSNKFTITNKDIVKAILTNSNLKSYSKNIDFGYVIDMDLLTTNGKNLIKDIDCQTLVNILQLG